MFYCAFSLCVNRLNKSSISNTHRTLARMQQQTVSGAESRPQRFKEDALKLKGSCLEKKLKSVLGYRRKTLATSLLVN